MTQDAAGVCGVGAADVTQAKAVKASYECPRLTGLGTIAELTAGNPNQPMPENGGGQSV